MPNIVQNTPTSDAVDIFLNGDYLNSSAITDFSIDIYQWNTGSNSLELSGSYATNVTPTTPSTYNGNSLLDGYPDGSNGLGYGVNGVVWNQSILRVTTTGGYGQCQGASVDVDLTHAASRVYNPGSNSVITPDNANDGTSGYATIVYAGSPSKTTGFGQQIAHIKTLPWGKIGTPYAGYNTGSYFQGTHISSVNANGTRITGSFANGPLQSLKMAQDVLNTDGQHFIFEGAQIPNIQQKVPDTPCHSVYRLTWVDVAITGSYNYVDIDFYWDATI